MKVLQIYPDVHVQDKESMKKYISVKNNGVLLKHTKYESANNQKKYWHKCVITNKYKILQISILCKMLRGMTCGQLKYQRNHIDSIAIHSAGRCATHSAESKLLIFKLFGIYNSKFIKKISIDYVTQDLYISQFIENNSLQDNRQSVRLFKV